MTAMPQNKDLYLIGAGGHAKVIIALLEEQGCKCLGIYDDDQKLWGTKLWDIPIMGPVASLPDEKEKTAVISIGNNEIRRRISKMFKNLQWETLVHPHSWVHPSVVIGEGTVVFAGAVIQPDTVIGAHTIINTSASVDHDCRIGDYCHIAPGCHVAGGVFVGAGTFIGAGVSIIPNVSIASDSIVGAGAVIAANIPDSGLYIGVPARKMK